MSNLLDQEYTGGVDTAAEGVAERGEKSLEISEAGQVIHQC